MEEREEMKAGGPSKPPPPSPTSNHERGQGMGDKPHKRRRRQYRRHHHHHTLPNALVNASPPTSTPNPGKHPPPFASPSNEHRRERRQRRSRRRHPRCVPANEVVSSSPPNHISNPGKHPPSCSPPEHEHGGSRHNRRPRPRHRRRRHCRRCSMTTASGVPPPNLAPSPGKHPPPPLTPLNHRRDKLSPRHRPAPPPQIIFTITTASCAHERPPNGRLARPTRVLEREEPEDGRTRETRREGEPLRVLARGPNETTRQSSHRYPTPPSPASVPPAGPDP
jgi:hypothetical protein